ncbi:MAG: AAA family ATPase, partial [Tateyamaria sp.]
MSQTSDQMELREAEITAHYPIALALLQGFDHAPRIGKGEAVAATEKSSGIGTRRRFRTTTPGLVTRRTTPAGAVQVMATIEGADADDALMSPVQATVLNALRRSISIALAVAENYASVSGLGDLKRANLEGALPAARKTEFAELLAAEA